MAGGAASRGRCFLGGCGRKTTELDHVKLSDRGVLVIDRGFRCTATPPLLCGALTVTDSQTHRLTRRTPSPATASLLAPKDPKRESQATTRAHLPTFGALEHRNRPLVSSPLRPSPKSYRRSIPQSLSVSEASRHAVQFLRNPLPTTFMK
ncbi:hypothetical protein DTO166G4_5791 [Paecilomyces variotii]|nr:hypothetical protein DTO166G4_5791 [Paecilomyces variotii]KAJ9230126.1 hypothetical protein DTO166G5_7504 [Paecilomyces variotii]KAJ9254339.1 hypothetical protein DTO195F2_6704 [Paecilomyces variotii]KAJ9304876.1 hypothetical protein DTO217A2_5685 [Paecilomyces variotii]KAJ9362855.1 hypothetical protein DTO280E4_3204 [Paecilomyces variotii]